MLFKDRIIDIITLIESGKTVLIPCDHKWHLAISSQNQDKYDHLYSLGIIEKTNILLFESLDHLKRHLPSLHPRVETMLVYYKRSFLMKVDAAHIVGFGTEFSNCYVSIARNDFLKTILSLLGQPLRLLTPRQTISDLNTINQKILNEIDYICKETEYTNLAEEYVIFSYDEEGLLVD
ncbi:MAG TPA: hypothetical protein PKD85_05945 [Saprospiraceae bacterium]|nr:hypothetical protein [Saprospiraceae bacterium]